MKFLRFLFLIFFILFSQNVFAENKIVFIDIDFLMKNSNIGKLSLKKLEQLNNKNVNLLGAFYNLGKGVHENYQKKHHPMRSTQSIKGSKQNLKRVPLNACLTITNPHRALK